MKCERHWRLFYDCILIAFKCQSDGTTKTELNSIELQNLFDIIYKSLKNINNFAVLKEFTYFPSS